MNEYTLVDAVTRTYDQNGNLTADATYTYDYDAFNRLVKVDLNPGWVYYVYDHKGRRVSKQFDWDENGMPEDAVYYFYLGNRLIEEQDSSGNTIRQYVWRVRQ